MKERNIGIDILKFFAALMITNSHMGILYGNYSTFATGGAIGDALFFFCSGYTLFLGKMLRFDNWYKKRINRIYPTVFAWAILEAFIFKKHYSMDYILIHGGGWFVTCIMIYYIILYIIRKLLYNKLYIVFILAFIITIIWYFSIDRPDNYNMYGYTYFKWCHYFLFMLLGSIIGSSSMTKLPRFKNDLTILTINIVIYYAILVTVKRYPIFSDIQIISLIPLLYTVYYFYKVCSSKILERLYNNKIIGWIIKFIGGLCLEIYLVQYTLFTDKMNNIFPFNIIIMFIIIVFAAYILRCFARFFSQTFKDGDYNWKSIIQPINDTK